MWACVQYASQLMDKPLFKRGPFQPFACWVDFKNEEEKNRKTERINSAHDESKGIIKRRGVICVINEHSSGRISNCVQY